MIVREAYRDATHALCQHHYDNPPEGFPPLGPVQDARRTLGCEVCQDDARVVREDGKALVDMFTILDPDGEGRYWHYVPRRDAPLPWDGPKGRSLRPRESLTALSWPGGHVVVYEGRYWIDPTSP